MMPRLIPLAPLVVLAYSVWGFQINPASISFQLQDTDNFSKFAILNLITTPFWPNLAVGRYDSMVKPPYLLKSEWVWHTWVWYGNG